MNFYLKLTSDYEIFSKFKTSPGGQISQTVSNLFKTPGGVYLYYPSENGIMPTVLYTPKVFQGGSSITHFDKKTYAGSSDYLMRPTAQPGAGLDSFIPGNGNGPLGKELLGILRSMGYIIMISNI